MIFNDYYNGRFRAASFSVISLTCLVYSVCLLPLKCHLPSWKIFFMKFNKNFILPTITVLSSVSETCWFQSAGVSEVKSNSASTYCLNLCTMISWIPLVSCFPNLSSSELSLPCLPSPSSSSELSPSACCACCFHYQSSCWRAFPKPAWHGKQTRPLTIRLPGALTHRALVSQGPLFSRAPSSPGPLALTSRPEAQHKTAIHSAPTTTPPVVRPATASDEVLRALR